MRAETIPPILALITAAPLAAAQTTWYVDVNGARPGSGTQADPYTSLQHALDQASTQEGDTILVLPGTYAEHVDYRGKSVRVASTAGPGATLLQATGGGPVTVMNASTRFGGEGCTLEGFTVTGATGAAPGIFIPGDVFAKGAVLRCILRANAGPGVLNGYDLVLLSSTVTANARAIESQGSGCVRVSGSILWGNAGAMLLQPCFNVIDFSLLETDPDPRFWDAAAGDVSLRADSPAIDAGDPGAPRDPDGTPADLGALPYDPFHAPGTARYCFGSAALCPCGNGGSGDAGCDIAQGTGGVALAIRDFLPDGVGGGTAGMLGTGYPPAAQPGVTLIRSLAPQAPPVVFGDGLRCIGLAGFVRVGATLASGGTALLPVMHGAGGGTFYYQLWSRNMPAMFCTPEAFNLSNGLAVVWP